MTGHRTPTLDTLLAAKGIGDDRVLAAFRQVPRAGFTRQTGAAALADRPQPIGWGQTISQPYIVARMLELAALAPGDRVLDIGTGSGYAAALAAVLAAPGGRVWSVERVPELAAQAVERLQRLGYSVRVRIGDGTLGWPAAAPFEAILVAAAGPRVPEALKAQLADGGRLVMPVGAEAEIQRLVRVTRRGDDFAEERLEAVAFVPLTGRSGWPGEAVSLSRTIAAVAERLPEIDAPGFAEAFDHVAGARVVLLGESTHGTAEFYRARAAITRRLVQRHRFTHVCFEADWPDIATVDARLHGHPDAGPEPFARFPRWMWRNAEMRAFLQGLRDLDPAPHLAGLDLYALNASMAAVLAFLEKNDPAAAVLARERYGCLEPWAEAPQRYPAEALRRGVDCEAAVAAQLTDLMARRDGAALHDAQQNARLVAAAEEYYRAAWRGGPEAWNRRDRHMAETLAAVLDAAGPDGRAVVWAHNSHVGDARATWMAEAGEVTLGQLARERWGDEAVLIGFGTGSGLVCAAADWGEPGRALALKPPLSGSFEAACRDSGIGRFLLDQRNVSVEALEAARLQRFVGVIYRPQSERASHYAAAIPARQFDAWVWIDHTHAVTPLDPSEPGGGPADTWPYGV